VRAAEYICKDCGRIICKEDYVSDLKECIDCSKKYYEGNQSLNVSRMRDRKNIWKPTLVFILSILALFFIFAIIIYPDTGLIFLASGLPISRETLIMIISMIVYPLILLIILGIFIKYIWLRTLS